MKSLLAAAWSSASPPSAAKQSPTPATIITTSIHLGTSCTRHPAGKSTRSALRNVVTAALAFRSITAGPARTTAAWRTGIDLASYGWRSFVAARLPEACASARWSVRAESPLRCIWIQSYAFGSANLHDQSLRVLRRGERANHSSRVGEVVEWLLWTSSGRRVSVQFGRSLWRSLPLSSRWPL